MRPFPVEFTHLRRMTDDTGLLEHALGKIPRRREGYTTDDNARALWMCVEWMRAAEHLNVSATAPDAAVREARARVEGLGELADVYLSYLVWVQGQDGWFHNNVAYGGRFEPEEPSADCQGRALWATACAALWLPREDQSWVAQGLCKTGFRALDRIAHPRGWAHALSAAALLLREADAHDHLGADFLAWVHDEIPRVIRDLALRLVGLYERASRPGWHWFEPVMTYSNGVFPWALWEAWPVLEEARVKRIASDSLAFLADRMTAPHGHVRPIGNRGWCTPERAAQWDQQPIEVMKLALACRAAHAATGDAAYREIIRRCREWYHGANDLGVSMVDPEDGACFDGLCEHGVNANCGAESTLSYLICEAIHLPFVAGLDTARVIPSAPVPGADRRASASGV
ncbi:glycosyl transferase [Alicyclobacillus sp.]|uniref:glycosyl transferase n=1 Tax=Alicyclobacillus sp. TaxID=61169 RepID=UPI0025BBC2E0|nr:glycosyl transferase [Alicyclobacillus sp.]MCL6516064.1 glycosyl transferase [Alicyclobacillus sp.]